MDAKIIAGILAAGGAALAAGGVYRMNKKTGYFKKGNSVRYDVSRIPFKKTSPLKGKTVVFLGSSVTKGFAAHNNAFAEYIAKKDSCICIKEAVNGTTLIDNCEDSYIERMRDNLDPERQVDLFICQLSTNDATRNSPLGEISESRDLDSFDVKTVCGAIEYIIAYAKETWHCRVMFYTNPQYDSDTYAKMVEALLKIQEKWQIGVIDFWNDERINSVSPDVIISGLQGIRQNRFLMKNRQKINGKIWLSLGEHPDLQNEAGLKTSWWSTLLKKNTFRRLAAKFKEGKIE